MNTRSKSKKSSSRRGRASRSSSPHRGGRRQSRSSTSEGVFGWGMGSGRRRDGEIV
jgi:hypothetical protein